MNLVTLRAELRRRTKADSLSNAQLNRFLNLAQDDVVSQIDAEHLITTTTFATVANQRIYRVPDIEYNKVLSVVDETNGIVLRHRSEYDMEDADPEFNDTGTSSYYTVRGYDEFQNQPSAASVISIVSSAAGDTTQRVRLHGVAGGVARTQLLTLNGTTTVAGAVSFTSLTGVRKDATTTGNVTVTSNAGAVTVAVIGPDQLVRFYQPIVLQWTPNAVATIRVRYIRKPKEMVYDEDVPDVGSDVFHELVLIGATIRGFRDIHHFDAANNVQQTEWLPGLATIKRQQGNLRSRKSPVIGTATGLFEEYARLPARYGWPVY